MGIQPQPQRHLLSFTAGYGPLGPSSGRRAEVHHQPERVLLHGGANRKGGPEKPMKTRGMSSSVTRGRARARIALILVFFAAALLFGGGSAGAAQNLDLVVLVDTSES